MINVFTAATVEIDDVEAAVSSLLSQLAAQGEIGENALGLITCQYEFVLSGVVNELRKALPFPIAGCTSSTMAMAPIPKGLQQSEAEGDLCLTLMVLWGEGVTFTTATTESVALDKDIANICQPVFAQREKPALVWSFAPRVGFVAGDLLVEAVTELSGGALVFGGYSVDDSPTFQENCYVITPDGDFLDRVGFVLCYGDIKPSFYCASITEKRILDRWFMVTEAKGNEIISINDRSSLEFLELIGITAEMTRSAVLTNLVLAIQVDKTSYYPRQIVGLSDNDTLMLGGTVENGTRFRVGGFDKLDMLTAAQEAAGKISACSKEKAFVLIFSCASRFVLLGSESLDEIHMVREATGGLPFLMAYAGGEICPLMREDGSVLSHFQNGAFVMCAI
jgi:small ligand-binding sensory domain FIST